MGNLDNSKEGIVRFIIDGILKWSDRFRVRLCSKNNKYTFLGYVLE